MNIKTFFQRQFSSKPTTAQVTFDVLIGIVAPLACILIDKVVFGGLVSNQPAVSYIAISIWVYALIFWLLLNPHWGAIQNGLSAIILVSGAIYAGFVGSVLLPFTYIGLVSGIMGVIQEGLPGLAFLAMGLLGCVPFGTAFAFFRNGVRAFRRARSSAVLPNTATDPHPQRVRNSIALVILLAGVLAGGWLWGTSTESRRQETISENTHFPVYSPSIDVLQALGIAYPPTVTLKFEKACRYLEITYSYVNKTTNPALIMHISDGCAYSFWRSVSAGDLSWAEDNTTMVVGESSMESPEIVFNEPLQHFQYFVFSQEPLTTTLTILESMHQGP